MKSAFDIIIAPVVTEKCNALIQEKKYTFRVAPDANRIEIGKAIAMVGMCIALSSALVYDKKTVVLSVLGTHLSGIVLDHFIFGNNIKRRICIISEKQDEILNFVLKDLHSGATIYEAKGAYTSQLKTEVIVIVNKSEYRLLMNYIQKVDPDAFVTIYNVNEVIYRPKNLG